MHSGGSAGVAFRVVASRPSRRQRANARRKNATTCCVVTVDHGVTESNMRSQAVNAAAHWKASAIRQARQESGTDCPPARGRTATGEGTPPLVGCVGTTPGPTSLHLTPPTSFPPLEEVRRLHPAGARHRPNSVTSRATCTLGIADWLNTSTCGLNGMERLPPLPSTDRTKRTPCTMHTWPRLRRRRFRSATTAIRGWSFSRGPGSTSPRAQTSPMAVVAGPILGW